LSTLGQCDNLSITNIIKYVIDNPKWFTHYFVFKIHEKGIPKESPTRQN
jgi:hypothetical protein